MVILAAVFTVNHVVAGHDGGGLGLFYRHLKGSCVYFTKGPLVYLTVGDHSVGFLVIAGVVLQRCSNPFFLHGVNIGRSQASCKKGVL